MSTESPARLARRPLAVGLLALAALLVVPTPSSAQYWYVAISGGKAFEEDMTLGTPTGTATTVFDSEYALSAAVGYEFAFPLRVEAEFVYVNSDVRDSSFRLGGGPVIDAGFDDGTDQHFAWMVNAYYDVRLGERWKPYVGGGIGVAHDKLERVFADGTGAIRAVSRSGTFFAYQLKAGIAFAVAANVDATLGYRYLRTEDRDFDGRGADNAAIHAVEVGLRLRFR